jgi:hypothetical protein
VHQGHCGVEFLRQPFHFSLECNGVVGENQPGAEYF